MGAECQYMPITLFDTLIWDSAGEKKHPWFWRFGSGFLSGRMFSRVLRMLLSYHIYAQDVRSSLKPASPGAVDSQEVLLEQERPQSFPGAARELQRSLQSWPGFFQLQWEAPRHDSLALGLPWQEHPGTSAGETWQNCGFQAKTGRSEVHAGGAYETTHQWCLLNLLKLAMRYNRGSPIGLSENPTEVKFLANNLHL